MWASALPIWWPPSISIKTYAAWKKISTNQWIVKINLQLQQHPSLFQLSTHCQFRMQYVQFGKVSSMYQHKIYSLLICHCSTAKDFPRTSIGYCLAPWSVHLQMQSSLPISKGSSPSTRFSFEMFSSHGKIFITWSLQNVAAQIITKSSGKTKNGATHVDLDCCCIVLPSVCARMDVITYPIFHELFYGGQLRKGDVRKLERSIIIFPCVRRRSFGGLLSLWVSHKNGLVPSFLNQQISLLWFWKPFGYIPSNFCSSLGEREQSAKSITAV